VVLVDLSLLRNGSRYSRLCRSSVGRDLGREVKRCWYGVDEDEEEEDAVGVALGVARLLIRNGLGTSTP
jgi:hypothetical protein